MKSFLVNRVYLSRLRRRLSPVKYSELPVLMVQICIAVVSRGTLGERNQQKRVQMEKLGWYTSSAKALQTGIIARVKISGDYHSVASLSRNHSMNRL